MNQLTFGIFLLLPSMALCFVVLATFYGPVKAYSAISWIPITLFIAVSMLFHMENFSENPALNLGLLLDAIRWTSLIQGMLGVSLIFKTYSEKKSWGIPVIASLLTALPFFLTI